MKTKILIAFLITISTAIGTTLLLKSTLEEVAHAEMMFYTTPTINIGKSTARNFQSESKENDYPMKKSEEVTPHAAALFSKRPKNNVYVTSSATSLYSSSSSYGMYEKHVPVSSTRVGGGMSASASVIGISGAPKSSSNNSSYGVAAANNAPESKSSFSSFNRLEETPTTNGSSPADEDDDESIEYVSVGEGLCILLLLVSGYFLWKFLARR